MELSLLVEESLSQSNAAKHIKKQDALAARKHVAIRRAPEAWACGTSLSPQSFQSPPPICQPPPQILSILLASRHPGTRPSDLGLQSSWNVSYRGSNPPPKAATGGHRGPQAATGRHRLLNILVPEPLKTMKNHRKSWKSIKIYENPWKSLKIQDSRNTHGIKITGTSFSRKKGACGSASHTHRA